MLRIRNYPVAQTPYHKGLVHQNIFYREKWRNSSFSCSAYERGYLYKVIKEMEEVGI